MPGRDPPVGRASKGHEDRQAIRPRSGVCRLSDGRREWSGTDGPICQPRRQVGQLKLRAMLAACISDLALLTVSWYSASGSLS